MLPGLPLPRFISRATVESTGARQTRDHDAQEFKARGFASIHVDADNFIYLFGGKETPNSNVLMKSGAAVSPVGLLRRMMFVKRLHNFMRNLAFKEESTDFNHHTYEM